LASLPLLSQFGVLSPSRPTEPILLSRRHMETTPPRRLTPDHHTNLPFSSMVRTRKSSSSPPFSDTEMTLRSRRIMEISPPLRPMVDHHTRAPFRSSPIPSLLTPSPMRRSRPMLALTPTRSSIRTQSTTPGSPLRMELPMVNTREKSLQTSPLTLMISS